MPVSLTLKFPVAPAVQPLTNGQLALVTAGRFAITTIYRVLYPLLPFLAIRFGVSLQTATTLVAVLVLCGLVSPIGGALVDTRGERLTMSLGLVLFCAGATTCALAPSFLLFAAGYLLIGLSIAFYQPAAQAYLSARTPYERRGWALGIFEISWALSALLGVAPLMQLVETTGTISLVFWVILITGAVSLALMRRYLPPTPRRPATARAPIAWGALRQPRVLAMLALFFLSACAVDQIFVVQGAWLTGNFGASAAQLGQVFALMGVAELIGAGGSTLLVDRWGKKRSVVLGFSVMAVAAALFPLSEGNWLLYLPLLFLFDLCFEFAIVSSFPLASGVAPQARGSVMALSVSANGLGRATGSLTAEPLWRTAGFGANAIMTTLLVLAGVALCARFVRETEQELEHQTR